MMMIAIEYMKGTYRCYRERREYSDVQVTVILALNVLDKLSTSCAHAFIRQFLAQ
jgi:hypothetical protein